MHKTDDDPEKNALRAATDAALAKLRRQIDADWSPIENFHEAALAALIAAIDDEVNRTCGD